MFMKMLFSSFPVFDELIIIERKPSFILKNPSYYDLMIGLYSFHINILMTASPETEFQEYEKK